MVMTVTATFTECCLRSDEGPRVLHESCHVIDMKCCDDAYCQDGDTGCKGRPRVWEPTAQLLGGGVGTARLTLSEGSEHVTVPNHAIPQLCRRQLNSARRPPQLSVLCRPVCRGL